MREVLEGNLDNQPSVVLQDLRKLFGGFVAVDGVSLTVQPGEFVTLLGPSGCGKTTTLRMIGGFEFPTSGSIATSRSRPVACTEPGVRSAPVVVSTAYARVGIPGPTTGATRNAVVSAL